MNCYVTWILIPSSSKYNVSKDSSVHIFRALINPPLCLQMSVDTRKWIKDVEEELNFGAKKEKLRLQLLLVGRDRHGEPCLQVNANCVGLVPNPYLFDPLYIGYLHTGQF